MHLMLLIFTLVFTEFSKIKPKLNANLDSSANAILEFCMGED